MAPRNDAMGRYVTYARQQGASPFDRLVGAGEYGGGRVDRKRLGCFEIEHKPQLGGSLYRQLRRLRAFQNLPRANPYLMKSVGNVLDP